ncbi:GNAT family N-acetyltransferase [Neobacillus bataviensis]|uniref:GNAT family N-acetyltransferase n=1 Tax=Neobacillus bataviensis TaxID=220685 RepID=UPI0021DB664F|nr:GNAT family N-acetyltransferase [Neobacillus bataviensis]
MNGEVVGSVFVVDGGNLDGGNSISKLRLLLVDPEARELGLGTRLVKECIQFSKQVGYKKMVLWTNSILIEARHIYQTQGFKLVAEENHHILGHD